MGRLQRIELENFKSYHGKQIIGPFEDFTCIIGPNGAGKSNMMDAISFVLGVQSKHLRSNHLKELVFRKDANSVPARKASVKLFYVVSYNEVDGRADGSEISFCRSISAAGVSSYRLDNHDVTYDHYEHTLQQIGVLVKARNFLVFQGDVEAVASKSPQDLTKLIEQISGSDQYSAEYDDLLRRKAEAEENTLFSMQKKKMYSTQCREVKGQKDEAEYFQKKQDELRDLKTEQVMWRIWCVKSELEGKQHTVEALKEDMSAIKVHEEALEAEMTDCKRDHAKVGKSLSAAEKSSTVCVKQLDAVIPKLAEANAKLKSLQKRLLEQEKSRTKVNKDLQQQKETVTGLQHDISDLQEAEDSLKHELQTCSESGLKLDASGLNEYSRLREEVSSRIAAQRADELTLDLDLRSKQELLQRLKAQEDAQHQESENCDRLIGECEHRNIMLSDAITSLTAEHATLLQSRTQLNTVQNSNEAELLTLRTELDRLSDRLREAGDERRRSKQEERMEEAISTMQRIFKGVHGKLVNLCKPIQRKYSLSVSVAAGKQMDAIVVDSKNVATECIQYLKDQRVGCCLFLPLDNLLVKPLPERLRTFGSQYRPCVDLLECDEMYKQAVSYAVGSTLVCETLEEAQELCFERGERIKVVTLRGHVINKSGAMTGGSTPGSNSGGSSSNRWEEKEIEKVRHHKVEVEQRVQQLTNCMPSRQDMLDMETRVRACQSKIKLNEADLKVAAEKLSYLQQQKTLRNANLQQLRADVLALSADVSKLTKQLSRVHSSIQAVEAEVFAKFSAKLGIANIREYEDNSLRKHQELLQKHSSVAKQCAALSAQLQYERKRDFAGVLARLGQQMNEARQEEEDVKEQEQTLLREEIKLRAAVKEANQRCAVVKHQKDELLQSLKDLQARRSEMHRDRDVISKKLAGEEILMERGRTQLHEILQKAQVDEVALPTVQRGGNDNKIRSRGDRGSSSNENSSSGMMELSTGSSSSFVIGNESEEVDDGDDDDDDALIWTGTQTTPSLLGQKGGNNRRHQSNNSSGDKDGDVATTAVAVEASSSNITSESSSTIHFSQKDNPTVLRDKRDAARVDLSSMRNKYKNLTKSKIDEIEKEIQGKIAEHVAELEAIQPNMHAAERYDGVLDKLRECSDQLEGTKEIARHLMVRFEEVKKQRQKKFQECYGQISQALDSIYKDLTHSSKHPQGGKAWLTLDNMDEPYLSGVRFTVTPPMKRYRDMDQLSGGEKTMAALALLFSVHSFRQAPFFVLDEVDAALDNVNVKKICNYIRQRSHDFQCIVISLKDMFFEHADCLVGICKDVESLSSEVLMLELNKFEEEENRKYTATDDDSPNAIVGINNTSVDFHDDDEEDGGDGDNAAYFYRSPINLSVSSSSLLLSSSPSGSSQLHHRHSSSVVATDSGNSEASLLSKNSDESKSSSGALGKRKLFRRESTATAIPTNSSSSTAIVVAAGLRRRSSSRPSSTSFASMQQSIEREVIYEGATENEDDDGGGN